MKKVFLIIASIAIVSCGPSAEEQAAIDALQSELYSLQTQLETAERSQKFWWGNFNREKDLDLKIYYGNESKAAREEAEVIESEITEVKFKLAQLQ